jgi:hypothetical protein
MSIDENVPNLDNIIVSLLRNLNNGSNGREAEVNTDVQVLNAVMVMIANHRCDTHIE